MAERPTALSPLRRGTRVAAFVASVVVVLALPAAVADSVGTIGAWAITLLVLAVVWVGRHLFVQWRESS